MRYLGFVIILCLLLNLKRAVAQMDSICKIKVHFLYGSRPKRQYRSQEVKYFGGLHGGHVSIQVGNNDYGFEPTEQVHIFPHKKYYKSDFVDQSVEANRYDTTSKVTTFIIPLNASQYAKLSQIHQDYCLTTPYDYAFFGMRCAAATQDVLGKIGIVPYRKRWINILTTFYPKRLRKRLFRLAKENHYTILQTPGRPSRRWEND